MNDREHQVKTYTTLEQRGLSDADMAEDDFVGNLAKINNKIGNNAVFMHLTVIASGNVNLHKSLMKQLIVDIPKYFDDYVDSSHINLLVERTASAWDAIRIELMVDSPRASRERMIVAYANRDGDSMRLYPFKEVATTKQITVEPLNGWENYNGAAIVTKSGRYVNVDFDIRKGLTDRGTILFALPEGFRPPKDIAMMVIGEGGVATMRTVVNARGGIKLYDATAETVSIIGKGGFPI